MRKRHGWEREIRWRNLKLMQRGNGRDRRGGGRGRSASRVRRRRRNGERRGARGELLGLVSENSGYCVVLVKGMTAMPSLFGCGWDCRKRGGRAKTRPTPHNGFGFWLQGTAGLQGEQAYWRRPELVLLDTRLSLVGESEPHSLSPSWVDCGPSPRPQEFAGAPPPRPPPFSPRPRLPSLHHSRQHLLRSRLSLLPLPALQPASLVPHRPASPRLPTLLQASQPWPAPRPPPPAPPRPSPSPTPPQQERPRISPLLPAPPRSFLTPSPHRPQAVGGSPSSSPTTPRPLHPTGRPPLLLPLPTVCALHQRSLPRPVLPKRPRAQRRPRRARASSGSRRSLLVGCTGVTASRSA